MIEEPYRWVEAVANRREYIEDQLRLGSPIVLITYSDGLLLLTLSRETRKIFEVYDKIAFAALGHPADIERMRQTAIDLAHVEGFNRAVNDVSLRRLVSYGLSPTLKGAFEQVYGAPLIVKMLLVELGEDSNNDYIVKLDYDGSFARNAINSHDEYEALTGAHETETSMIEYLSQNHTAKRRPLNEAIKLAAQAWAVGARTMSSSLEDPETTTQEDPINVLRNHLKSAHVEAAVLDRKQSDVNKFRLLDDKEIRTALKGF